MITRRSQFDNVVRLAVAILFTLCDLLLFYKWLIFGRSGSFIYYLYMALCTIGAVAWWVCFFSCFVSQRRDANIGERNRL